MKRLEKLNKMAEEKGYFRVVRAAKGHYIIFKNYNDYLGYQASSNHYSDYKTMSYEECYDSLKEDLSDNNNRRKMLEQLEEIRSEGKFNMFMERKAVAREAMNKGYHSLFVHIAHIVPSGLISVDNDQYMDLLEGLGELDE